MTINAVEVRDSMRWQLSAVVFHADVSNVVVTASRQQTSAQPITAALTNPLIPRIRISLHSVAASVVLATLAQASTGEPRPRSSHLLHLVNLVVFTVMRCARWWKQLRPDAGALEGDWQQQEPAFWVTERVISGSGGVGVRGFSCGVGRRPLSVHLKSSDAVSVDAVEVVAGVPAGTFGLDARVKWINLAFGNSSSDARRVIVSTARHITAKRI